MTLIPHDSEVAEDGRKPFPAEALRRDVSDFADASPSGLIEILGAYLDSLGARFEQELSEEEADLCSLEFDAAYDMLSFQKPKTFKDAIILMRALDSHTDMLANGVQENEDKVAREVRAAKVERLQRAVTEFLEVMADTKRH
jgi:hypothetical protein